MGEEARLIWALAIRFVLLRNVIHGPPNVKGDHSKILDL